MAGIETLWLRLADRRQVAVDRAAQRMYERLARDPSSFRRPPSRATALVVSAVVLTVAVLALVAVVAFALLTDLWTRWPILVLAAVVVLAFGPRPARLDKSVVVLTPTDAPGLHALVGDVADRVGVRRPRKVGVDYAFNAYVQSVGWLGRPALVIGLPLWASLPPEARAAVLGHELGHLRHRDTGASRVVIAARRVLRRVIYVLQPNPVVGGAYAWSRSSARARLATRAANVIQAILSLPFLLLDVLLVRLNAAASQFDEYLADRRSAQLVGSFAMQQGLSLDAAGLWTRVAAAQRRGVDPWQAFADTPAPDAEMIAAHARSSRLRTLRRDASHPPDHLRIELLGVSPLPMGSAAPTGDLLRGADTDLVATQDRLRRKMADQLRTVYYR